jgi:hypothetical protein
MQYAGEIRQGPFSCRFQRIQFLQRRRDARPTPKCCLGVAVVTTCTFPARQWWHSPEGSASRGAKGKQPGNRQASWANDIPCWPTSDTSHAARSPMSVTSWLRSAIKPSPQRRSVDRFAALSRAKARVRVCASTSGVWHPPPPREREKSAKVTARCCASCVPSCFQSRAASYLSPPSFNPDCA